MKFLLLAVFVVFCAASTVYRGKNISINDDGSIMITSSSSGKRVVITKGVGYDGQKAIDITIAGPNIPTKRIQIDEGSNLYDTEVRGNRYPWSSVNSVEEEQIRGKRSFKKEKSQADVLFEILREYQGPVSEPLFEKLLGKIDKAVKKGEISRQIYDLLVELDRIDNPLGEVVNQVGLSGQNIVPERYVSWYTRVTPQIQGGRVVVSQEQIPLFQRSPYAQNWGTTRYINPLLERWLQGQQSSWGVNRGIPTQLNIGDQILVRQPLGGIFGGLRAQQSILDELLARQQRTGEVPVGFQTQPSITDEILARQQLNGEVPLSPQTQQNIVDEILIRQRLNGGVPVSLQTQQNIVDQILARQQLNGGVPLSVQTQQNIIDEILTRQQLNGGVPLSLQSQQSIVDEILARQRLYGGVPLSLQTQQNIVDEILARQQLNGGVSSGLQTNQGVVSGLLGAQQLNRGISRGLQSGQNILDEILTRQQLRGGVTRSQNMLEEQQLDNDVARALETEQDVANDLLIQQQLQQQQELQQLQQLSGVSSGWQSGQNVVGNLLRPQQWNSAVPYVLQGVGSNVGNTRGVLGRSGVLLREYLTGSPQVPYSQRGFWRTLMNRPLGYQGITQGQSTIMQNGRGVYMDNMGVPQVVY